MRRHARGTRSRGFDKNAMEVSKANVGIFAQCERSEYCLTEAGAEV